MKIVDKGVSQASFMDFSIPSDFARSALYFSPQFGHLYCDSAYRVARDSLDLMLLVYVCSGALHIETQGHSYTARAGEVALLDCHRARRYYCTDQAEKPLASGTTRTREASLNIRPPITRSTAGRSNRA